MESHESQAQHQSHWLTSPLNNRNTFIILIKYHPHHRHPYYWSSPMVTAAIHRTSTKWYWISGTVWLCHMHLPGPVFSTLHISPHLNCLPRGEHVCYCHFAGKQGYAAWLRDNEAEIWSQSFPEHRCFYPRLLQSVGTQNCGHLFPKENCQGQLNTTVVCLLPTSTLRVSAFVRRLRTLWSYRGVMSSFPGEYSLTGKRLSR